MQLKLRLDVLVPDFQACLVTAAHKIGPGDLRPQSPLQRVIAGAAGREQLGQLLRIDSHAGCDGVVGLVDLRVGDVEAVTLGLGDLQDLVDQAVEHFLA